MLGIRLCPNIPALLQLSRSWWTPAQGLHCPTEREDRMLRSFVGLLNRILGRCPRCMRQAFLAALGAWGLAAALIALDVGSWMATPMVVVAIGLTGLWLAHVAAFALRVAMSARHAEVDSRGPRQTAVNSPRNSPGWRRSQLWRRLWRRGQTRFSPKAGAIVLNAVPTRSAVLPRTATAVVSLKA